MGILFPVGQLDRHLKYFPTAKGRLNIVQKWAENGLHGIYFRVFFRHNLQSGFFLRRCAPPGGVAMGRQGHFRPTPGVGFWGG